MTSVGVALSSVLAAAIAAGCVVYLLRPSLQVETHHRPQSHAPAAIIQDTKAAVDTDRPKHDEAKAIEAFQKAADAILSRAPEMRASVANTGLPLGGKIPLPRRRPIPRS
jgi:hypothetical protein